MTNNVLLVDTTSVYSFQQQLKEQDYPVQGNINYAALMDALRSTFPKVAFTPMLAFVSINPEHEGQRKFCSFLKGLEFIVDETDYRDAFILPDRKSQYQRLSTRITYVLGMLSRKSSDKSPSPHVVVVTDAFEVYHPLRDYVENRGGKATVAFFQSGLEPRWNRAGLFDESGLIGFKSLDDFSKSILGIDIGFAPTRPNERTGLGSFRI